MRKELKNISETNHELYESDFDYTINISKKFAESRVRALPQDQASIKVLPNATDETIMEVLDDVAYYTYVEMQYIWHYCLWRLQGILEGIITGTFLKDIPTSNLIGMKSKLDALKIAGFTIDAADYSELIEWAKLRNHLSHRPPGSFFPGPLDEPDIEEYSRLCKKVCAHWRKEYQLLKAAP